MRPIIADVLFVPRHRPPVAQMTPDVWMESQLEKSGVRYESTRYKTVLKERVPGDEIDFDGRKWNRGHP